MPLLDAYLYDTTNVAAVGTALALKCYKSATNSKEGYRKNTVREARVAQHMRQSTLAHRAGILPGALNMIEEYGATPSLAVQQRLADALGCTIAKLWPEL